VLLTEVIKTIFLNYAYGKQQAQVNKTLRLLFGGLSL